MQRCIVYERKKSEGVASALITEANLERRAFREIGPKCGWSTIAKRSIGYITELRQVMIEPNSQTMRARVV